MSNRRYNQFYFTPHKKPVQIDCSFIVTPTNAAGVTSLSSSGSAVPSVWMHTSTTPIAGSPNPQNGVIIVNLADNFNKFFFSGYMLSSPNSGSDVNIDASDAALTQHNAYTIVALGTSTTADWVAVGVPVGTTPAVGVSFVATATGAGTGTGKVQAPAATGAGGIYQLEVIGDPNVSIASKAGAIIGRSNGNQIILGCYAATNSSTTTGVLAAPAAGTKVFLKLLFSSSTLNANAGAD